MAKSTTVGRSKRTPAKHALMSKLYGREVGVANRKRDISDLLWLDLTAGDGVASEPDRAWRESCSPGILAHHARWPLGHKPVTVVLHEKQVRTYESLLDNHAVNLPGLGYGRVSETEWSCGSARLVALNVDGATADLSGISRTTAVMVSNDPNAISDWAMPAEMPAAIRVRTPYFLGISTMGCNAGGLKRWDLEKRQGWYGHINSMISGLPSYHDLHLSAIEGDAAQWAYLITAPAKWRGAVEEDTAKAFGRHGMSLQTAWWKTGNPTFREIADVLFLTKQERGGDAA